MIIKTTMNSSKKTPTCPSDEIAQLRKEQQEILKEIELCRKKGWLKAIFPLQVENAIIELKIKRNEYPTTN